MWFYRLLAVLIVLGGINQAQSMLGPDKVGATSIELGAAGTTDTTITRSAAGVMQVENVTVPTVGAANTFTAANTFSLSTAGNNVTLLTTDAGAAGSLLKCQHDSATPAASDVPCDIQVFAGADDEEIGRISYRLLDGSTTTEDGAWDIRADVAGASTLFASIGSGGTFFPAAATQPVAVGSSTAISFNNQGAFNNVPDFEVVGNDSAAGTSGGSTTLGIAQFSNTVSGPHLFFGKSRGTTPGSHTIAQEGDLLGFIMAMGSDGTDFEWASGIEFFTYGGPPGDNDMPGQIVFRTSPGGVAQEPHNQLWLHSDGTLQVAFANAGTRVDPLDTFSLLAGGAGTAKPHFQVVGSTVDLSSQLLAKWGNDTTGPILRFAKSDGTSTSYTNHTLVDAGDELGSITWEGADGTDFAMAAKMTVFVNGITGADDMAGVFVFSTSAADTDIPLERVRIGSSPAGTMIVKATDDGAQGPVLTLQQDSASSAADDIVGAINLAGGANDETIGRFEYRLLDGTNTSEDGVYDTYTDIAGSDVRMLSVGSPGGVTVGNGGTAPGRGILSLFDSAPTGGAGGSVQIGEDTDNGANYKAFGAPASITATTTCTLLDSTSFIPYGCIASTQPTVTVNGATTFAVTTSQIVLQCTGAETIDTITGGVLGMRLLILHGDTECTINDDDDATASNAVNLTGTATTDVGAVDKVIELIYDGTHWLQVSESANG